MIYTAGTLPTTPINNLRSVSVYSTHATGVDESPSTDKNSPHKVILPVSPIQKVADLPQQENNGERPLPSETDRQLLSQLDQEKIPVEFKELTLRQAMEVYKNSIQSDKDITSFPPPGESGARENKEQRNFIQEILDRYLGAQLPPDEAGVGEEVAERNYIQEIRNRLFGSQPSPDEKATREKVEDRNYAQEIQERQLLNPNMINYRQTLAKHYNSSQAIPLSPAGDYETNRAADNRVLLYNRAITAYIRQKLFFSSINKIGLMTRA